MSSVWTWDETRQAYFIWTAAENAWVYADGTRVYANESQPALISSNVQPLITADPRTFGDVDSIDPRLASAPSASSGSGENYTHSLNTLNASLSAMTINQEEATYHNSVPKLMQLPQYSYNNPAQGSYAGQASRSQWVNTTSPTPSGRAPGYGQNESNQSRAARYATTPKPDPLVREPKHEITPDFLFRKGVKAHGRIRGTKGSSEKLDKAFKKRKDAANFFKRGKVFKMLWPEVAGSLEGKATYVTDGRFGEPLISKIRWFVVIKEGNRFCVCLPIVTYERQGVAKHGVTKWHHAIVWSGRIEPGPQLNELPGDGEHGMMKSIKVVPNSKIDKLDPMSRINFAKIYTVEHNVKVYDFGDVHKDSVNVLRHQWLYALERDTNREIEDPPTPAGMAQIVEEPNDDGDEEKEDDEDNVDA